jgi:hypothetical protein
MAKSSKKKKNKKIEPICNNCRLFDPVNSLCSVVILYEGEKSHLPVSKEDTCFFENEFLAISPDGKAETFKPEVQQIKWWVENEKGEKSKNGQVFIEYPDGLFGKE